MHTWWKGQPHSFWIRQLTSYLLISFTLITVAIPARGTDLLNVLPATPRSIPIRYPRRFSPYPALCTVFARCTRPLQRHYVFNYGLDYRDIRQFVKKYPLLVFTRFHSFSLVFTRLQSDFISRWVELVNHDFSES